MDSRDKIWSTECLKNYVEVRNTVQEAVNKTIPKKKKRNKATWLSEEALPTAEERREAKGKGEKERHAIWTQNSNSKEKEESLLSPDGSHSKIYAWNAGDLGLMPGSGRSPGEGGYPLQGRTPWTEEPSGLQFMGVQRIGHDWETNTLTLTFSEQCKETEKNNRMRKTRELFKGIRDTKGMLHVKMGTIKDRNDMDLTEAEDTKQRWKKHTKELYQKDLGDLDDQDGVITHLEPDILECEVKWAFGSITTNQTTGGDKVPAELFQTLKDDAVKVLHSIRQQIWKSQ